MAKQTKHPKKQTFRFTSPGATSVLLVGDFTRWQQQPIPMQRDHDGIWRAEVDLPPGKYSYRFIVDSEWRDDPDCTLRIPNPFGGHDMVREAA
jgi:1,4-alpha-glucan branching enzyme